MQKTYVHPWYTQLQKLENTMTSASELMQKPPKAQTGQKPTKTTNHHAKQIIDGAEAPHPLQVEEDLARYGEK
tara:strand:- start:297 stop:515 length:219 start_codon:yes stop_codon:yes gene_type:complete